MSHVKKYIVVPSEQIENDGVVQQFGGSKADSINSKTRSNRKSKKSSNSLLRHLLQIAIKLAKIDAFEIDGRIRSIEAELLDGTNVIDLLDHVCSPRKTLHGLDEFIKLRFKAGVEPDMILNRDVKIELMKLYQTSSPIEEYRTSTFLNNAGDISTTAAKVIESESNGDYENATHEYSPDDNASQAVIESSDIILPPPVASDSRSWAIPSISLQNSKVKKKKDAGSAQLRRSNRPRKERFIIYGSKGGMSNIKWIEQ